jgi:hypothetical protein
VLHFKFEPALTNLGNSGGRIRQLRRGLVWEKLAEYRERQHLVIAAEQILRLLN